MRLPDWDVRLIKYIDTVAGKPFGWECLNRVHDCTRFASGGVEAETGEDPMQEFRGKYDDKITAARALREIGQGTLYRTMVEKFGDICVNGRRGDVAFTQFPEGKAVGICLGNESVFVGADGLVKKPSSECGFFRVE